MNDRIVIRQTVHIRGHLWQRYAILVNQVM